MENTRIYIARHGETELNKLDIVQGSKDVELNKTGLLQAKTLGDHFADIHLDLICSSTMIRARQTAQMVADSKQMEVETFDDLREMNFGDFEGLKITDIKSGFTKYKTAWADGNIDLACKNGESPLQVFKRADPCFRSIVEENAGKTILFVLHGRLIRILFTTWFDWNLNMMNTFETRNVSYSIIDWNGKEFIPRELNANEHLMDNSPIF